ncbi:MAG: hypothetical protein A2Z09_05485 [Nitrospirae bacterium RBG_16_43_8]|nr:MAG: hypothetical protein A2Z09_05485 [Nitrospirae bacterium RBG_16_43_8]
MAMRSNIHYDEALVKELPLRNSVRQRIIAGARRHFFAHGLTSKTGFFAIIRVLLKGVITEAGRSSKR